MPSLRSAPSTEPGAAIPSRGSAAAEALKEGLLAALDVASVEEGELNAVVEANAIATPREAVGQGDGAFGAGRDTGEVDDRPRPLAHSQLHHGLELSRQLVWFPDRHGGSVPVHSEAAS